MMLNNSLIVRHEKGKNKKCMCVQQKSPGFPGLRKRSTVHLSARQKLLKRLADVGEHFQRQARIYADPERIVHHGIGIGQHDVPPLRFSYATPPEVVVLEIRLIGHIAREQQPRANLFTLEKLQQFASRKAGGIPDGQWIAKPARLRMHAPLREYKCIVKIPKERMQIRKVFPPLPDECRQPFKLCDSES